MSRILREMSWTVFEEIKKNCRLVIIPTGAVETYGPHLPLGTDGIIAEEMAKRLSEKCGGIVAPSLQVGESRILNGFPGTLSVTEASFQCYLENLCDSLRKWGFDQFLFVTGHAGNLPMVSSICKKYKMKYPEIQMAQIDWWRFASTNSEGVLTHNGYMAHGHASECATSIMLHLKPELVDMSKAVCTQLDMSKENHYPDILQYFALHEKTSTGMIGDALSASAEKGEKVIEKCMSRIVSFIEDYYD
jgi:creatinine amidohydrolase